MIGVQIGYITAVLIDKQTSVNNIILYASCIIFFALASVIFIYIRQKTIFKNVQILKKINKYKYVLKTQETFKTTVDGILKFKLALYLCNFYIEENDFSSAKKAIDMIKQRYSGKPIIEQKLLSSNFKLKYYLKQIYLSTMENNILEAHSSYLRGKKYIDKYLSSNEYRFQILKVLAEYEYAKGDYSKSEKYLTDAINDCKNESEKDKLKILLAKVYYRCEKYQQSELLLEQIIGNNSTFENVKNAKKLLLQKIV